MTKEEDMRNSNDNFIRLQRKIASLADKSFPLIDCWNFKAALGFLTYLSDGKTPWVDRLSEEEILKLEITPEMLKKAIEEAGGSLSRTGLYPISDGIKEKLRSFLNSA